MTQRIIVLVNKNYNEPTMFRMSPNSVTLEVPQLNSINKK